MSEFKIGDKITVNAAGVRMHTVCTRDCTQGKHYTLTEAALPNDFNDKLTGVAFIDDVGDRVGVAGEDVVLV